MPDTEHIAFAAEFPADTRDQWLRLVDGVLKGAPFDKRLVTRTYDGLADPAALFARRGRAAGRGAHLRRPWAVMQRVDHPDPALANVEALHDLENGANRTDAGHGEFAQRPTDTGWTARSNAGARVRRHLSRCRRRHRLQCRRRNAQRRRRTRRGVEERGVAPPRHARNRQPAWSPGGDRQRNRAVDQACTNFAGLVEELATKASWPIRRGRWPRHPDAGGWRGRNSLRAGERRDICARSKRAASRSMRRSA